MKDLKVGIVGLGYVGLPLAMEFCKAGVEVVGVDVDQQHIAKLKEGHSYVGDVSDQVVRQALDAGKFLASTDFADLRKVDSISICVPTPLSKSRTPDVSYVTSATGSVAGILQRGQTVVLESTVYPGATEELVVPMLEESGLKAGTDFYVAFSPERIDPGNTSCGVAEIPKLVGGINRKATKRASAVYRHVFDKVFEMDSPREAEMAKLLENTFRAVNIGMVNELAVVAHGMGIDIWKVVDAASTKPFGFMPFYPGPGWGGHCIPIDPFYLTWKARIEGMEVGFIEQAGRVNTNMPGYVVSRIGKLLNEQGKCLSGARVLLLGLAYKRNVGDVRESPALEIFEGLEDSNAVVQYHDPFVERLTLEGEERTSVQLTPELLEAQDCVVIVTDHSTVDYDLVARHGKLVFDTRNATKTIRNKYSHISVL